MTPLLEAAVAARKAGFDAPRCYHCGWCGMCAGSGAKDCPLCGGEGLRGAKAARERDCAHCHATGLDVSDPERLIGRAFAWLVDRGLLDSSRHMQTWSDWNGGPKLHEEHDRTPTGLAAALLRLVARVGGKQP